MSRREVRELLQRHDSIVVPLRDGRPDLLVVGEGEPQRDARGQAVDPIRNDGLLRIITETQLWERVGLIDPQQHVRRLYTPWMLSELLDIPVAVIRRWHRQGLITAARTVRRLAYFDFQEVSAIRRLAELLAAGCSPRSVERKLVELLRRMPGIAQPLRQMSLVVDGRELLLRGPAGGLCEPSGQLRFDFAAADESVEQPPRELRRPAAAGNSILEEQSFETAMDASVPCLADGARPVLEGTLPGTPQEILAEAAMLEAEGNLSAAADAYRSVLAAVGPQAEVQFLLAEVLYRMGDRSAARERYYAAIEADEEYVEARASLGCLLLEMGQQSLAIAALQGALSLHPEYSDAHYHLARALDLIGRKEQAERHWRAFLELVPDSPWAEEVQHRLECQ
jgi:tetratricopeptide (TPR) repeat protein